jgi:HK97 family phage prohead protease
VDRSESCPESKPFAVIKDDDGEVEGCHETEEAAKRQMAALYASEGKTMEHATFKAVATTTDQGTFTAVISAEAVDREKDIVSAQGMVAALQKWNRPVPLAWNHSTEAEDIFGHIDPSSVHVEGGEVVASGEVDLESKVGQEAWRSFKRRTIGFSFGYLILESTKRKGGGRHITELDVFEVTATPTPMNNATRVLTTKAAAELAERETKGPPSEATLQKQEQENRLEEATKGVPEGTEPAPDPVEKLQAQVDTLSDQFEAFKSDLGEKLEGIKAAVEEPKRANTEPHDPLRKRSEQAVLEIQTDGISSRKSPPVIQEPVPEPLDESDLRARSRRTMLELLTGVPNDKE